MQPSVSATQLCAMPVRRAGTEPPNAVRNSASSAVGLVASSAAISPSNQMWCFQPCRDSSAAWASDPKCATESSLCTVPTPEGSQMSGPGL